MQFLSRVDYKFAADLEELKPDYLRAFNTYKGTAVPWITMLIGAGFMLGLLGTFSAENGVFADSPKWAMAITCLVLALAGLVIFIFGVGLLSSETELVVDADHVRLTTTLFWTRKIREVPRRKLTHCACGTLSHEGRHRHMHLVLYFTDGLEPASVFSVGYEAGLVDGRKNYERARDEILAVADDMAAKLGIAHRSELKEAELPSFPGG